MTVTKERALSLGFIGAGRVGTALARALDRRGHRVLGVASRTVDSARRLAQMVPGCKSSTDPQEVAEAAGLVFITTPDEVIAQVAAQIRWHPGQIVVHCSGATSLEALQPAQEQGALVGGLHPLQSFASGQIEAGATFALEGDGGALQVLEGLVQDLEGLWFVIKPEDKALYHLAAVYASNYVVTLAQLATTVWRGIGIPDEQANQALLALMKGTVNNLERVGLPNALTGPIARGDLGTVEKHLQELGQRTPELGPVYRELALLTVPIALEKGTLAPLDGEKLMRHLRGEALVPTLTERV